MRLGRSSLAAAALGFGIAIAAGAAPAAAHVDDDRCGIGVAASATSVASAATSATSSTAVERSETPVTGEIRVELPGKGVVVLDANQEQNARTIVSVVQERDLPRRAAVIAIATAFQESMIKVYANERIPQSLDTYHEAVGRSGNSVGIFQQQVGPGFGMSRFSDAPLVMDPVWSTNAFLDRMIDRHPDWQGLSLATAAEGAQDSGDPDAYTKWENNAERVVAQIGW